MDRRPNCEEVRPCLTKYWIKYITVNPNRTVSLSKFSFFKLLHLLIRSYQVPVLFICPMALSHFLKFKVFTNWRAKARFQFPPA